MALSSVGPYRVLERLGAGANGEVCLAEDTRLHRRVALKALSGTAAADGSDLRRRLLREARAAARLNHPHIAAVYDVLESDEGVHIVMEYVRGTTLATRLRQAPPTPMQVLDIALQLADALVHAHSLGVIHRDLKPANIVVASDGAAKILDFGLARLCEVDAGSVPLSASELSVEGRHVVGTPPYIPPEHLAGAPADVRGDIYSLGVTLFELLTGRRPFEASNGMGLTDAILGAPTPRVSARCPDCPAALDAIVYRAMSRNPSDRYPSAADMRSDLRRLSAGITDVPTQSRPWPLVARGHRRRLAWAAAAMAAGALAVSAAFLRSPAAGTPLPAAALREGPKVVAVLPLAGVAGDPQDESLAAGVADTLIATLSKVPGVTVVSRASTLKYQDRKVGPDEIAAELGATLLVDGTLLRSGDRVGITLSVRQPGVKVASWRNTYDGAFAQVFELQREVAAAVAGALSLPDPGAVTNERPTVDIAAFADYAQARTLFERTDVKENLDRSVVLFRNAIERDPRFARAHAGLAEAYWRKYETTRLDSFAAEADAAIATGAGLDPRDAAIRMTRGAIYRGTGRLMDAARELKAAIAAQPAFDEAHRLLGTVLVSMGEHDAGMAEMQEAIALRPGYWANHATLGTAYYNRGRYAEAAKSFEHVVRLQPESSRGYSMLGSALHAMDDTARAVHLYEKAIALGSATASANLGMLHYELGGYSEAARHLAEAVRRDPNSALLRLNLADAHAQMGHLADARREYRSALELGRAHLRANAGDARALARVAVVLSKLGLGGDAARHIDEAVIREPNDPNVNFYQAVVRLRAGRPDDALKALDRALASGYSRRRASTDPDLAPLRGHSGYQALIASPAKHGT